MSYDPARHHRRSIRLPSHDYTQSGGYFITICVRERVCALGAVSNDEMQLNRVGEIVAQSWSTVPDHFPTVVLDTCVVMPNHFHGILFLTEPEPAINGVVEIAQRPTLATIIGAFKTFTARQINITNGTGGAFWQRGYYEHIVRNELSLERLRRYIAENPARWTQDQLHPDTSPWR